MDSRRQSDFDSSNYVNNSQAYDAYPTTNSQYQDQDLTGNTCHQFKEFPEHQATYYPKGCAPYQVENEHFSPTLQMANSETGGSSHPPPFHPPSTTASSLPSNFSAGIPHNIIVKPPTRKPIEDCEVCGAPSSGFHYGVMSCEGCKGFFRRYAAKLPVYVCRYRESCPIRPDTRSRCQFCRVQKCLAVGMRHVPRRPAGVPPEELPDNEIITVAETVSKLYTESSEYTQAKMAQVASLNLLEMKIDSKDPVGTRRRAWESFAGVMCDEVIRLVGFIEKVPKLEGIDGNDKAALIRQYLIPLYLIRILRAFSHQGLRIKDGRLIDFDGLRLLFGTALEEMVSAANRIRMVPCLDSDLAIFSVTVLLQGLSPTLRQQFQFTSNIVAPCVFFNRVLKEHVCARGGGPDTLWMFAEVLTSLNKINRMADKCFLNFLRKNRVNMSLPPLLAEVLNLNQLPSGPEEVLVLTDTLPEQKSPSLASSTDPSSSDSTSSGYGVVTLR